MRKLERKKGITLIALVVTIIVLLILAGISIQLIGGSNGILSRASNAIDKNKLETAKEQVELLLGNYQTDFFNAKYVEKTEDGEKREYIKQKLSEGATTQNYYVKAFENDTVKLYDGSNSSGAILASGVILQDGSIQWDTEILNGEENVNIQIVASQEITSDFLKGTLNVEITYEGNISEITIKGQKVEIPEAEDGIYKINQELLENGNYEIVVKDENGNYQKENVNVTEITEDMDIWNREDMELFRDKVNSGRTFEGRTVRVMDEIDLEGSEENQWVPVGQFKGTFDGKNHVIDRLYIRKEVGNQALFARNEGTIKNVIVKGSVVGNGYQLAGICAVNAGIIESSINYVNVENQSTTQNQTGGVVSRIVDKSKVINCENYGMIISKSSSVGGIIGHSISEGAIVEGCANYGKIEGSIRSGGIMGSAGSSGIIRNCSNYGEIKATSGSCAGGILAQVGTANPMVIQKCVNSGKVEVAVWGAGGIIGNIQTVAQISQCKNDAEIFGGNGNCGGIIGSIGEDNAEIYISTIEQCINRGYIHATGNSGNPVCGGILGTIQLGEGVEISNSYNIGKVASTSYTSGYIYHGIGGIVGCVYNNATNTTTKSKATIKNCYNRGAISNSYSSSYAGQILGRDHNNNREVSNCYYLSIVAGSNSYGGTSVSANILKTYASTLGSVWKNDERNLNDGYPILKWQEEFE